MARYKKTKKSNDEIKEQKRLMQEAAEKEQDRIWHEEETFIVPHIVKTNFYVVYR